LMFAFVAYQLWGTGIQTAQAQRSLAAEFDKQVAGTGTASTTIPAATSAATTPGTSPASTDPTATTTPETTAPSPTAPVVPTAKPVPAVGKGVARLEIPRIDLNRIVVEGATADELAKGPGHFPETPLPGQLGNASIAGHRTTHLAPFFDIDKLQPGDEIKVTTLNGRYVYHVTGTEVVGPDDYAAVVPTVDVTKATLTLVSCTPRYSATNRIVVRSELVLDESDPLTQPLTAPTGVATTGLPADSTTPTLPGEGPVTVVDTVVDTVADTTPATTAATSTTAPATPIAAGPASPDAFADGWFSDSSAILPALLWGGLLAAIGYGIYWVSRRFRRYSIGILTGFVPFIVTLYFFYENINRLLPPNL